MLVIPNVHSLAYSPDGRDIAVIAEDRRILILDSKTGEEKTRFLGAIKKDIRSAVFSPNGKSILTQSEDGEPKLWNLEKKRFSKTFKKTTHAAYSPDGNSIVTANAVWRRSDWKPITITILDAITLKENANQIQLQANGNLDGITYSPDGKSIILQLDQSEYFDDGDRLGEKETGYQVLNTEKLTTTFVLEKNEGSISMACSPDGNSIAASFIRSSLGFDPSLSDRGLKLWDAQTGEEKYEVKSAAGKVLFSPDGESIILAPQPQSRTDDGMEDFGFGGEEEPGGLGEGEPDGGNEPKQNVLFTILDSKTGKKKASFKIALPESSFDVALSPDGNSIAVGMPPRPAGGGSGKFGGGRLGGGF